MSLHRFNIDNKEEIDKTIYTKLALVLLALFIFVFLLTPIKPPETRGQIEPPPNPFLNLTLEAKAVYVFDIKEGKEIYSLNGEMQLPLASLTKIMTALTALDVLPEGTLIKIMKESLQPEGDSGLLVGENWRLSDLIGLTLVESSNDGAKAIASVAGSVNKGETTLDSQEFIKLMNQKANSLGLLQTYFLNETGLDVSTTTAGGYGSARDIAQLLSIATSKYPAIFEATRYESITETSDTAKHNAKNTNMAIQNIPNMIGGKTGYTDLAGGNVAVTFDAGFNHPVAVVVLGSTLTGRFDDLTKLVWATLQNLGNEN